MPWRSRTRWRRKRTCSSCRPLQSSHTFGWWSSDSPFCVRTLVDLLSASVNGFEDRHDLLSRVDRARVGEGPVVEHAVRGDALQVAVLDADVAQAPRQAKPG